MPGLYIHIPFCAAKCAYCDFLSFAEREDCAAAYIEALAAEIGSYKKHYAGAEVTSVFFGGGTPTLLSAALLAKPLQVASSVFTIAKDAEITVEANPETVDYDKLCMLREAGFNRISFGVQSFDDTLLRRLGRIHSAETAERAVINARQAGFTNINIDLMFGLPGQSLPDWTRTLSRAIALAPEHLSCYSLIVEENTPLARENPLDLPDEDTDRAMYAHTREKMALMGYSQYEISNFAKPGFESRHNGMYWTGGEYIGLGLGAHSLLERRRLCNTDNFTQYCNGDTGREVLETLTDADLYAEFMILGLRMTAGVSAAVFQKRFNRRIDSVFGAELDALVTEGLLVREGDRIRLTARGVDISNRVFVRFLATEGGNSR